MRKVCIFSNDILFARMLKNQIELSRITETAEISINDEVITYSKDSKNIIILDLDSNYTDNTFPESDIIGFSFNRSHINKRSSSICREILLRPFKLTDLFDAINKIINLDPESRGPKTDTATYKEKLVFTELDSSIKFYDCKLHLSKNEYDILYFLAKNHDTTVNRDDINRLLGAVSGNICDVYICKLRSKLASVSSENIIFTVRNKGYVLKLK